MSETILSVSEIKNHIQERIEFLESQFVFQDSERALRFGIAELKEVIEWIDAYTIKGEE